MNTGKNDWWTQLEESHKRAFTATRNIDEQTQRQCQKLISEAIHKNLSAGELTTRLKTLFAGR
ncbi:hypothetical protein F2C03_06895 [Salmonella enterica]|nr:hypothetical protein [Salmonella enterica]